MDELHLKGLKVDSLVDLLRASFFLEEWDKMIEIADELLITAKEIYGKQNYAPRSHEKYIYGDRKSHIIHYFGFSHLSKGIALQKKERLTESRECIQQYADLSWLDDGSNEARVEMERFKWLAKGNTYVVNLLEGKMEYLDVYVQFLKNAGSEGLFPGLITILESALKHNIDVNKVLESFQANVVDAIYYYEQSERETKYITTYYYLLALYKYKAGHYEDAVHHTLEGLEASDRLKDVIIFKKCVALFEICRKYASNEQKSRYCTQICKILKEDHNEKNYYFNDDRIGIV